ncbi:hypothetical protein VCHA53O466_10167 [Vibrio chagasii]|nr:hypothetical protein VCHA53O466_10167 [Vibrio chagasii]
MVPLLVFLTAPKAETLSIVDINPIKSLFILISSFLNGHGI